MQVDYRTRAFQNVLHMNAQTALHLFMLHLPEALCIYGRQCRRPNYSTFFKEYSSF